MGQGEAWVRNHMQRKDAWWERKTKTNKQKTNDHNHNQLLPAPTACQEKLV